MSSVLDMTVSFVVVSVAESVSSVLDMTVSFVVVSVAESVRM